MPLEFVILLYAVGFILLIAEVFVPGGFLGVGGAIALVISIYFGFAGYGLWLGLGQIALTLVVIPLAFYFGLKRLRLAASEKTEEGFSSPKVELEQLIDKDGVAFTNLRPAGTAVIDGRKIDVVTEGAMINKDTPIKVIKVEGVRVIVRATDYYANPVREGDRK